MIRIFFLQILQILIELKILTYFLGGHQKQEIAKFTFAPSFPWGPSSPGGPGGPYEQTTIYIKKKHKCYKFLKLIYHLSAFMTTNDFYFNKEQFSSSGLTQQPNFLKQCHTR